jgi:hypothetical protein
MEYRRDCRLRLQERPNKNSVLISDIDVSRRVDPAVILRDTATALQMTNDHDVSTCPVRVKFANRAPCAGTAADPSCRPECHQASPPASIRCNCQALLASFECFNSKYRWQVARDFLPIFTFIEAREYRTTVCAEIDARRITVVTSHCLTEHSEEAALLWQTLTHRVPGMATVARPPDRCCCVEWKTSGHVPV